MLKNGDKKCKCWVLGYRAGFNMSLQEADRG